jgi:hypothetical protein
MRQRINLLGVGGVGTNILHQACRRGTMRKFMFRIFDPDTVEIHNLNRSRLFELASVGRPKTTAVCKTVEAMESSSNILRGISSPSSPTIAESSRTAVDGTTEFRMGLVIDARDTLDPTKMPDGVWVKLAYDGGTQLSFTWKPHLVVRMIVDLTDGGNSYEVVPSFFVPAAMLSIMTFNYMRFMNFLEITDQRAGTFYMDMDSLIEEVSYSYTAEEGEA